MIQLPTWKMACLKTVPKGPGVAVENEPIKRKWKVTVVMVAVVVVLTCFI